MLVYMHMYVTTSRSQKWALDPPGKELWGSCEPLDVDIEVNSGPLQEQHVLLTVELVFYSVVTFLAAVIKYLPKATQGWNKGAIALGFSLTQI